MEIQCGHYYRVGERLDIYYQAVDFGGYQLLPVSTDNGKFLACGRADLDTAYIVDGRWSDSEPVIQSLCADGDMLRWWFYNIDRQEWVMGDIAEYGTDDVCCVAVTFSDLRQVADVANGAFVDDAVDSISRSMESTGELLDPDIWGEVIAFGQ